MRSGRSRPGLIPDFRGSFHTDAKTLAAHAGAAGPYRIPPRAVAIPADANDVQALVAWAAREGMPLLPRGAATGMPGGNVGPWLAVDLMPGLAAIETVDAERRLIRCGPGAIAASVVRAAGPAGLTLPCLPSSAERCTIGGMVANNAAGARSFRHGSTRAWVKSLDVVWPDGTRSTVARGAEPPAWSRALAVDLTRRLGDPRAHGWPSVRKNSSGYALDRFLPDADTVDLVVGSEGTLGIVVGATLRLTPVPPERAVVLAGLPSLDAIPDAARVAGDANASACELFGRRLLEMAGLSVDPLARQVVDGAAALILIELEGDRDHVDAGLARVRTWAKAAAVGSVEATGEEERARLWEVRHAASPLIASAAEEGRLSTQFIEDSVVPVAAVPAYLRGLDDILGRARTEAVVFGHAGDGNIHVNPLVDVRIRDWRDRVRKILEETVTLVGELGGTLSGEHGDGRVRAPYLDRIWSPALVSAFREVKQRVDPAGLMNPGVILPLPGQDPLEGMWTDR